MKKMKFWSLMLLLALVTPVTMTSCGGDDDDDPIVNPEPEPEPETKAEYRLAKTISSYYDGMTTTTEYSYSSNTGRLQMVKINNAKGSVKSTESRELKYYNNSIVEVTIQDDETLPNISYTLTDNRITQARCTYKGEIRKMDYKYDSNGYLTKLMVDNETASEFTWTNGCMTKEHSYFDVNNIYDVKDVKSPYELLPLIEDGYLFDYYIGSELMAEGYVGKTISRYPTKSTFDGDPYTYKWEFDNNGYAKTLKIYDDDNEFCVSVNYTWVKK